MLIILTISVCKAAMSNIKDSKTFNIRFQTYKEHRGNMKDVASIEIKQHVYSMCLFNSMYHLDTIVSLMNPRWYTSDNYPS